VTARDSFPCHCAACPNHQMKRRADWPSAVRRNPSRAVAAFVGGCITWQDKCDLVVALVRNSVPVREAHSVSRHRPGLEKHAYDYASSIPSRELVAANPVVCACSLLHNRCPEPHQGTEWEAGDGRWRCGWAADACTRWTPDTQSSPLQPRAQSQWGSI